MPRRPVRDPDDAAPFPARYGSWRLYFKLLNNWRNRVRRRHQKETSAERNRQIQEFVTARQARFADPRQLRSYLNSVLERSRGEPIMHVTRLARDGNFYEIYTSPDEVKAVMAEHWKQWCAKRNPQLGGTVDLVPDSALDYLPPDFWRAVYRPLVLQAGAADAFAGTMIEPTYEELGAYVRSLTDGAGGPSNCTNAILKTLWNPELPDAMDPEAYPPRGRRLLMAIVCEVLRLRDLPSEMCESNIFGIPKKGVWDGDIEGNLRPITLQEVGLKLATGLLTKRLADAIEKHGVLKGVNYGFRKSKSTDDALHLTVAILEDAKEHHKPIYILLQDIRRAYDSVSWVSMELSLRRIGAPEGYIDLHRNIFERRRARAITGHGLSDAFELECGLPQGGIESPLHWLIFYDALLCAQQELDRIDCDRGGEGVAYVLGDAVADAGQPRARVTGCAYADDTQWWSGTAAGIQKLADVASEFFRMHDITVNASKTEFTYNNVSPEPEAPLLGHPRVPVGKKLAPGAHFKLLGVYLTANLSWTEQIRQMEAQARETVAVIARKQLTAQEACYIVEAVVQARIAYGLKVVPLSEAQCDRLDAIWLRVVKHHGGLAASTSNYALWSHGTYRLPRMAHLMAKNQITDLLARLCGEPDELLSQVMAHRVRALQRKLGVPLLPTEFLNAHVTPQLAKANTIAAVMPLLQRRQYRIQSNHARYVTAPYPPGAGVPWPKPAELLREYVLATHIPKEIFRDAAPALYAAGMYWMSSVTARDGERLCTWRDLHLRAPRNTLPWAAPPWWNTLAKALTLDASGKGALRHPMRQPPGTPPSAMAQLPGGAKKYIHRPDDFVCYYDLATIHDATIPPHVGRLRTADSEPGRLVATECRLEHWIPVPEEADSVADGAYCRCDGHCQHEIREPPLAQRRYNIIPGEGRRHWHDDHTCPRAEGAACRATSTCDDAGEHGTSIGGWAEHAAALGAVPGAVSMVEYSNVPAAECEGQVATRSGRASRKVRCQGLLEYFHPTRAAAAAAMDAHRWRMLLQARQEGDDRVQWHLLSPEDAAHLAELEADPPEPLHLPQDEAEPISSEQARNYYDELMDGEVWATFFKAWDGLEADLRSDLRAAETESDGTYVADTPAQVWTDGSLQEGQTNFARGAFAVHWPERHLRTGASLHPPNVFPDFHARLSGTQEINKAELQAVLMADMLSPFGAVVHIDNQNAIRWCTEFVLDAAQRSPREYIRHACSAELYAWRKLRAQLDLRGRPLTLVKVKAHAKGDARDPHNDVADAIANRIADTQLPDKRLHEPVFLPPEFSMPAVLTIGNGDGTVRRVEGDPKEHMDTLHEHHTHFAWAQQPLAGAVLRRGDAGADIGGLYAETAVGSRFRGASGASNALFKFRTQLLCSSLPANEVRVRDRPDLYAAHNPGGPETFTHVFLCPGPHAVAHRAETAPQKRRSNAGTRLRLDDDPTVFPRLWVLQGVAPTSLESDLIHANRTRASALVQQPRTLTARRNTEDGRQRFKPKSSTTAPRSALEPAPPDD
eukprot:tig00020531_g10028.t1